MDLFGKKCVHEWKEASKAILPSAHEQLVASGQAIASCHGAVALLMFKKKVIILMTCVKCGELKKFVEESPT